MAKRRVVWKGIAKGIMSEAGDHGLCSGMDAKGGDRGRMKGNEYALQMVLKVLLLLLFLITNCNPRVDYMIPYFDFLQLYFPHLLNF